MEPWYKVVIPRQELREGRSLDPSEFAVHLEQVVAGTAPRDYVEPAKFFARNYFSKALVEHCGMVLRRLDGETANTAPVLSLITQFGGGKTHTLTALYHLCNSGAGAKDFSGVADMMKATGLKEIPSAKAAIFVGNSWDASPGRETPWMDIADQLAGEKGRALFGKNAPGTKAIGELLRLVGKPVLILFDETLNYIGRHPEQSGQFHSFMQNLTVALTSAERAVGLFSLPASPTEMTEELREWQDKLTKVVGRVGKDLVANDASEVSEIVRRRLFENAGRDSMKRAASRQFSNWVFNRRDRLPPEWGQLSEDQIRAQFEACYPFHPATLTVFQRKWQALPQFQQTRTTLAMLGMWISCAYREGYGKARREPLLTLGSAPLFDREFLSAVLRQMGEQRLQAAIHADIAAPNGQPKSHAETLDDEDSEGAGRSSIHQRVAKTLFFESCGGQTDKAAHLPELYFAVGDPDTETALIHTAVQALERRCYFLRSVGVDGWRFGHVPTLKKVHADRKQALDPEDVKRNMGELVKTVFKKDNEIHLSLSPKDSTDVVDQAMLTMAVMRPDEGLEPEEESSLRQRITDWTRKCGQQSRQNPGGILWVTCEAGGALRAGVEELLAWQAVADDANRGLLGELEPDDIRAHSAGVERRQRPNRRPGLEQLQPSSALGRQHDKAQRHRARPASSQRGAEHHVGHTGAAASRQSAEPRNWRVLHRAQLASGFEGVRRMATREPEGGIFPRPVYAAGESRRRAQSDHHPRRGPRHVGIGLRQRRELLRPGLVQGGRRGCRHHVRLRHVSPDRCQGEGAEAGHTARRLRCRRSHHQRSRRYSPARPL